MFTRSIRHFSGCRQLFLPAEDTLFKLCFATVNMLPSQSSCVLLPQQPLKKIHCNHVTDKMSFLLEKKQMKQNYISLANCLKFSINKVTNHSTSTVQQCQHMCTKPPVSRGPRLNRENDLVVPPLTSVKALGGKSHSGRKKQTALQRGDHIVTGYAVGEKLFIHKFKKILQEDNLYKISPVITGNMSSAINDNLLGALDLQFTSLPPDLEGIIHVTNRYRLGEHLPSKDIFFFEEGSVVFWNIPEGERKAVLRKVQQHCLEPYDDKQVKEESDSIEVRYSTTGRTDFVNEVIIINEEAASNPESVILEKYTFSNALSQSVKLAAWEDKLDMISDSCEPMSQALRLGKLGIDRKSVLMLLGEIYSLRHKINMNSDLLDSPDFYWDRNELEVHYKKTCSYLSISKRTKVMNEKMDYCRELLQLVKDLDTTKTSLRIESLIVILIAVEVILGFWTSILAPLEWLQGKTDEKIHVNSEDIVLQVSP